MPELLTLQPPCHLSRREKRAFRHLCDALRAENRPLPATMVDTLADYVEARARVVFLGIQAERTRLSSFPAEYRAAVRALEATTALSRRLALDLGLVVEPKG